VEGFSFSTDVTVRFAETDAQGIAHHAAFVVWLEVARVAYLDRFAGGYQAIRDRGLEALTTEVSLRYHQAAYFDERLTVMGALHRSSRRALPLRVQDHARRRAHCRRAHEPRNRRARHVSPDARSRVARRCDRYGRGDVVVVSFPAGVTSSFSAGFFVFVPTRTTRVSPLYDVFHVSVRISSPFAS
jgi:YbgC/YbaW family acyl-CoA thioester hydrolase